MADSDRAPLDLIEQSIERHEPTLTVVPLAPGQDGEDQSREALVESLVRTMTTHLPRATIYYCTPRGDAV